MGRILRGTCNKFANSAYRLGHAALKKMVELWRKSNKSAEELARRKEGILKRIIDIDYRLMGMGLNRLKQQAMAIYNLKRSFCLRIMDKNVQLMAAAQRNLRDHAYETRHAEMKLKNKQEGIINRMMNAGARYMSMAWRNAIEWTRFEVAREEKELRLKKKVCMTLVDKNFALACSAMNNLKQWKNLADLDDEKEKMIGDLRGGLLDGMAKTKEKFNREMQRIALQKLRNANDKIKRMTKSIVLFVNKNGERQLRAGLNKLIENKRERDAYFDEYKPRMTKILMKFMRESATFMLSAGMKGLVDNKRNYDGLMAKRAQLCRMLEGVIMKSDSLAKRYHLHLLQQWRIKQIRAEKIMRMLGQSATGKLFLAWDKMLKNCELVMRLMRMNGDKKKRLIERLTGALESTAVGLWSKGYHALVDNYKMEMIKERVVKNLFTKILCKSDVYLQVGLKKLVSNYNIKSTFSKCRSLFNSMVIADEKWRNTLAYNYKMLKSFRRMNPWYKKMVNRLTKNVRVDPQISFWRLKDFRKSNLSLPANKIVKMKKMFAILKKYYELSLARAFWRIERYMDPETSFNLSTVFQSDPNK